MSTKFSVKICDYNPFRWYISFNITKPFSLGKIKHSLEQKSYRTLASTPTVMVFRSKSVQLTWNSHGLLQVDFNDKQLQKKDAVEDFVKELLEFVYQDGEVSNFR
ncbi:MAG: hypothetical protein ACW98F_11450 [Candidatus Hodarchaeales archaeon]|jgi:hypothetical protein